MDVIHYPNPMLKSQSVDVDPASDGSLSDLIDKMIETMREEDGVGLAAIQIGVPKNVLVYDPSPNGDSPQAVINPVIVSCSDDMVEGEEGCLSFPGIYFPVERYTAIAVEALNPSGERIRIDAEGFPAVVLQHEIDHLNGVVILDRATPEVRRQVMRDMMGR